MSDRGRNDVKYLPECFEEKQAVQPVAIPDPVEVNDDSKEKKEKKAKKPKSQKHDDDQNDDNDE